MFSKPSSSSCASVRKSSEVTSEVVAVLVHERDKNSVRVSSQSLVEVTAVTDRPEHAKHAWRGGGLIEAVHGTARRGGRHEGLAGPPPLRRGRRGGVGGARPQSHVVHSDDLDGKPHEVQKRDSLQTNRQTDKRDYMGHM